MKYTSCLLALAAVSSLATSASAYTIVSGDITSNTTWNSSGAPYILEGPIYVKNGATLTIQAGTIVRGQPRTGSTAPGSLLVTKTGRINAQGNSTNPVIFTTAAVDVNNDSVADGSLGNYTRFNPSIHNQASDFLDQDPLNSPLAPLDGNGNGNVSLWGGLVVLGSAPTNLGTGTGAGGDILAGIGNIEGIAPQTADTEFGGFDPNDDSGILRYISIRHGGDELDVANELNGLTLAGVGAGTTVEFIDIYSTFDDGLEIFGGTVNIKNISVVFAGDDQFDFDQGYTGKAQFLFAVMPYFTETDGDPFGSASGDKAGEWDGEDSSERGGDVTINADGRPVPFSYPFVYNMTVVGSDLPASSAATQTTTDKGRIQMRNGFNGWLVNSITVNTGSSVALEVANSGLSPFTSADNATAGTLGVGCFTMSDVTAPSGAALTALANGGSTFTNPASFSLTGEDQNYNGSATLNPRPTGNLPAYFNPSCSELGGGFFTDVSYRGAFAPSGALWTTGWTAANKRGFLAN
ncbi:MAG: hypothetical protein Q7P63_08485 [Verrucomicrobiota bacterium JB022]|nr:hypothetical protein [Verrucomicrobiota bacterium JB022]